MTLDDIVRWIRVVLFTIIFILTPDQKLSEYQEPVGRHEPTPTATPTPKPTDHPEKKRVSHPPPKPVRRVRNIVGKASWFATGKDGYYAAACYDLRKAIGPDWRGRHVILSHGGEWFGVVLNDWCGSHDKLIDLSDEAFNALAPLSRGVIKVGVGW